MKRNAVTWFVLGAATYALCAYLADGSGSARAAVPKETFGKPYTPYFNEWVYIFLNVRFEHRTNDRNFTLVDASMTDRGQIYTIDCFYEAKTKIGLAHKASMEASKKQCSLYIQ